MYGGGGHEAAGTCQVAHEAAPGVIRDIVARVNAGAATARELALV
jgi:nanoRNase/pAp phosphatase (c-di-AMP/oligoRNAs hydrolase)